MSTRALIFAPAVALAMASPAAWANPQGGVVSGGQATISQSGNTLDINQSSSRAIIDWQSFNIGSGEKTVFNQPSSSSIALNRVHDNNPSQILGALDANGQVILVNPNGVFFGKGSQVDVAGLVATTANISNNDFMAGNGIFSQPGNPNASVVNQGTMTAAQAGLVGFVAPNVENDGVITAKLGKVALASGDTFTLDMAGDNLITVAVSDNVKQQLVSNSGTIQAAGGAVTLTAAAARQVVDSLVENSGVVEADTVAVGKDGEITLSASGNVINSGTLSASGKAAGETGGSVTVTGNAVDLASTSVIDASGDAGGGYVKIGGDFHGGGTTPTAQTTVVEAGAVIDANAITSGDGGKVAVWSDQDTDFEGSITARGGANSGNGGYVETSGQSLMATGSVTASAPHGDAGTWLLDPADVTISTGADNGISGSPNFVPNGTQAESVLNVSDITTALNSGTSVTVTTGGDASSGTNHGQITLANALTLNAASNNNATLTLSAYSNILINAAITGPTTGSGKLNVILDADNGAGSTGVGGNGSGYISVAASISTNGGNITIGGGNGAISAGSGYAVGGSAAGTFHGVTIGGTLNAAGGNIVINGQSNASASGGFGIRLNSSALETVGNGTITLTGEGATTTGLSGGVFVTGNVSISTTGNGTATITGYGGNGSTGIGDLGVDIQGASIQLISNTLSIYGYGGGGTTTGDAGIELFTSTISNKGSGQLSLIGTGGTSSAGTNYGIWLNTSGTVGNSISGTGAGALSLTGIAGSGGSNNYGIYSATAAGITNAVGAASGYSGNITLQADTLSLASGTSFQTSGNIQIEPYTANTTVNVAGASTGLGITSTYLGDLAYGSLTIGNADDTGTMTIGAYSVWSAPVTFLTKNTGAISVTADQTATGSGAFTFTGGPVTLTGNLTTAGGNVTLNPAVTLGQNETINAGGGTVTFGGTVNGDYNLTASAATFSLGGAWGGSAPLAAVSLTSANALSLPAISASSIFAQTTGASSDVTLTGQLTASGTGTPVVLAVGRNVINSDGSPAIDLIGASSPRWLIYSTNPANNTLNGLTEVFHRYSCTYGGSCPSFPSTGNGLLYTLSPTITVTANNDSGTYGSIAALSATYSGFVGSDNAGTSLSGSPSLTTNATTSTSDSYNAGTWTITAAAGTLTSPLGYQLSYVGGTLSVAQKALTITGLSGTNKVYDATTADPVTGTASLNGVISGDVVNLGNGTASLADANVGSGKVVTYSGYSISGTDAADYSLSQPASSSANITPAGLTITASSQSKTYGFGGMSAALGTSAFTASGLLGSDSVSSVTLSTNATTSTSGNYNAGTWNLTPSTASGSGLSNYSITYVTDTGGLTVAQKTLTITGLSGTNKVYDATTADQVSGTASLNGGVSGDVVNLGNGGASFADPNVGTGKTVTFSGYSISGADAGDYALSQPASGAANITPASLTITASDQGKTYGFGGTSAALGTSAFTTSGLLGSDAVSSVTLSTNATTSTSGNYNAGTWDLTPSAASGSGLSNYSITYATGTGGLTVAQKALTVTGLSGTNKVYDATTADPVSGTASLNGVISGDVVNLGNGSASFADANVGSGKTVTFSGYSTSGADAGDYALSQPASGAANITPASLTITADNKAKTYGTSDPAFTYATTGIQGSDTASSVLSGNLTRDPGENVGNYTITQGTLSSNSNYAITYVPGTLTITTANLLAVAADNKTMTYGGSVPALTYTYSGLVNGDTSSVFTGSLATSATSSSNAGTYAITQGTLSAGPNYAINFTSGALSVTPAPLTVAAKDLRGVYASVSLNGMTGFTASGLMNGDTIGSVTLSTDATTSTSGNYNVGTWTITPSAATGGTFVPGNYAITYDNASTGLTVTPKPLTITGVSGTNKTYDATTNDPVTGTPSLSGVVANDVMNLSGGGASFADADVGSGKTVTFSGYSIGGADAGDYALSQPASSIANISPASLTVTAKDVSGTYGSVSLSDTSGFTASGLLGSDSVSSVTLTTNALLSTSSNYDAGAWMITPSAASGSGLSNYTITYANAPTGLTVAQRDLTITGVSGTSKVYDATTSDPVSGTASLNGLVSGDVVNLVNGSASFVDANVGSGKTVIFSGYSISGADAGDYALNPPASSIANITMPVLPSSVEALINPSVLALEFIGGPRPTMQGDLLYVDAGLLSCLGYGENDPNAWWDGVLGPTSQVR